MRASNMPMRLASFGLISCLLLSISSAAIAGVLTQVNRTSGTLINPTADVTGSAVFTDTPGTVDVGSNPLRDPIGRGLYSADDIQALAFVDQVETGAAQALPDQTYDPSQGTDPGDNSFFSMGGGPVVMNRSVPQRIAGPSLRVLSQVGITGSALNLISSFVPMPLLGGSGKTGIGAAFPWESTIRAGGSSAAPVYVNTQTGNAMRVVPIVSWNLPGGGTCGLTLYHNSQDDVDLGWGANWRSNYDFYVINLGINKQFLQQVAVIYPSGERVVFTGRVNSKNLLFPPAGFHDALTCIDSGQYSLRTKDQTMYFFSSASTAGLAAGPYPYFYASRLTQIRDRFGNTVSITRNVNGSTITSPTGSIVLPIRMDVNANNVPQWSTYMSISAPGNRTWTLTNSEGTQYDGGPSKLLSITYPTIQGVSPKETFTYNPSLCILTETAKDASSYTATYDSSADLASDTEPWPHTVNGGQVSSSTENFSYSGSSTTKTDPFGYTSKDNYSGGLLRSHVDEAGFSNALTWDANYNLSNYKNQRQYTSNFGYDAFGNRIWSQSAKQAAASVKQQASYDSWNDLTTITDCRGAITTFNLSADNKGEVLSVVDGLGNTLVTNTYNQYGDIATSTSEGVTTTIGVDYLGRPTSIATPDRTYTVSWIPGGFGFPDVPGSVTDSTMNRTTTPTTDAWGRIVSVTRSDGQAASVQLDVMNRVTQATDYLGHSSVYQYDTAGRLWHATNANGELSVYNWRDMDNLSTAYDGNGNPKYYAYSPRGDLAKITLADNSVESNLYDANGNQSQRKNALAQLISYGYDPDDNQTTTSYPSGTGVTNQYDNDGRPSSLTDASGTTTWTFDMGDRLTQLAQPLGILTYAYDQWGRRTSVTSPAGKISYGYTGQRLTQITSPQYETTTYSYDPNSHLLSQQNNPNGTYTSYSYDSLDRVSTIFHNYSSGASITGEYYYYDLNGNLTSKTVDGLSTNYQYDSIGQLLSESNGSTTIGYDYDKNGNRQHRYFGNTTETYSYDAGDKLLSRTMNGSTWTYTYDAAGRTTHVAYPTGATNFGYDYEDRVSSVTTMPTGGNNTTTNYLYNALDAREQKSVNGATLQQVLRDGVGPSDDRLFDTSFTYVPGVSERAGGMTHVVHFDRLGTATAQTDQSQTKTNSFSSDAFGNPYTVVNPTHTQTGFAGGFNYLTDPESGLMLLGHRYYDPGSGRFITRDPARAGSNWYAYCGNDPIGHVDANGLNMDSIRASISAAMRQATTDPRGAYEALKDLSQTSGLTTKIKLTILRRMWQVRLGILLMQTHHYLSQEFEEFFSSKGIDIEEYTQEINAEIHRIIHGKLVQGYNFSPYAKSALEDWNSRWRVWIDNNPGATKQDILEKMDEMAQEFNIPRLRHP